MNLGGDIQLRPAVLTDQHQIANLIHSSSHVHQHLDWRNPVEWIGTPPFFVLESSDQIYAALSCSPDPESVAWIRLFVTSDKMAISEAWQLLWDKTHDLLLKKGKYLVAAIVLQEWLQSILISSGFSSRQNIVMLERDIGNSVEFSLPAWVSIRAMLSYDLPAIAEVDAAAFDSLWQNSLPLLQKAYSQAICPTVAVRKDRILGYQISTRNPIGVHLARLAVEPEEQGIGIGFGLVADLISRIYQKNISHLTVNTQNDNKASLALYRRMGFSITGQSYPVYQLQIPS